MLAVDTSATSNDDDAHEASRDSITVLECLDGGFASKQWFVKRDGTTDCKSFSAGMYFAVHTVPVTGIASLEAAIRQLASEPRKYVIRGAPVADCNRERTRRLLHGDDKDDAAFQSAKHHWIMFDVDGGPTPANIDEGDIAMVAEYVRSQLPANFRDVTCFAQLSASAGFKPGVRCHLFFWLDRAVADREIKATIRAWDLSFEIDKALFAPVQPHYVAAPRFFGMVDPYEGRRFARISGSRESVQWSVANAAGEVASATAETKTRENEQITHETNDDWKQRAERKLKAYSKRIANQPANDARHPLLNEAAYVLGRWAPHFISVAHIEATLLAASQRAKPSKNTQKARDAIRRALSDGMNSPDNPLTDWRKNLRYTRGENPVPTGGLANIVTILRGHPAFIGLLEHNERSLCATMRRCPPWTTSQVNYPAPLRDIDAVGLCEWLSHHLKIEAKSAVCFEALVAVSHDNPVDHFLRYLESVAWDGVPRLGTWLTVYAGAEDCARNTAFGRKWAISVVSRAFEPGGKVDHVLVFEGAQGRRKSSLLRALAGADFFSDQLDELGSKDCRLQLYGPAIIELAELDALSRKDANTVKAFLSVQTDRFRAPYAPSVATYQRRCVFAATTNETTWLQDDENRRFWPVTISWCDVEAITRDRDQLWAEAVVAYRSGETHWLTPEEEQSLARPEQESRRTSDPWEATIVSYLHSTLAEVQTRTRSQIETAQFPTIDLRERFDDQGTRLWIDTQELLQNCIGLPLGRCTKREEQRVGVIMKQARWNRERRPRPHRTYYYVPVDPPKQSTVAEPTSASSPSDLKPLHGAAKCFDSRSYESGVDGDTSATTSGASTSRPQGHSERGQR